MKKIEQTYGYDDVAIVPGEITLNPELVDTNTKIGELELDVPIFASAMDSVVDPKFAKELSLIGPSTNRWVPEIIDANNPEDTSYYPFMNGQLVFKNAVVRFSEVILEGLNHNGLDPKDIDLLIPHQANLRISQFVQKRFGLSDNQVFNNIQKYGNTTAGSIPIALTEAWEQGKIKPGNVIVLAAFGSGFTWGSTIIRW